MRKSLSLLVLLGLSSLSVLGQQSNQSALKRNSIFLELAGSGLIYSLNLDHLISEKVAARIGFSHISGDGFLDTFTTIPLGVSTLKPINAKNHFFEYGLGSTFVLNLDDDETYFFPGPILGLRGQDILNGGGFWRITLTPFFDPQDNEFYFWGGVSVGRSF